MDYAKLTDSNGKTVDFRNVYLIMTTNAGAAEMRKEPMGFGESSRGGEDMVAINTLMAPEFRNRLDGIIPFKSLSKDIIGKVTHKFVDELMAMVDNRLTVQIDIDVYTWLANKGYDPAMGARPMARVISTYLKEPLSKAILFNQGKNVSFKMIDNIPTLIINEDVLEKENT